MRIAHKAMPFDNFYLGCKHLFVSIRDKHLKVNNNLLGILCGMASPELKTKPICRPLPLVMKKRIGSGTFRIAAHNTRRSHTRNENRFRAQ